MYTNATERGLAQHARMRHRISQLDGQIDSEEENFEEVNVMTLELDKVDRGHSKMELCLCAKKSVVVFLIINVKNVNTKLLKRDLAATLGAVHK